MIIVNNTENLVYKKAGDKNVAVQVLTPLTKIKGQVIQEGADFIIVKSKEIEYFLTSSAKNTPTKYQYVLQTDSTPTKTKFEENSLAAKRWINHPTMSKSTVKEVINSWQSKFHFKIEDQEKGEPGLRQPQIGALHMILGHLSLPLTTATVVLPTGTGKTETMISALVAHQCPKLLVTVPSDKLRDQLSDKFSTFGLLKDFGIIDKDAQYPIVGVIREKFSTLEELKAFYESCNVIVTTMAILSGSSDEHQNEIASLCSHVFIDEAHHMKATSWNDFKGKFEANKIVQFTATPFRNDGQRLDGKIIYNFPLKSAQEQGYFKKINFIPIREWDSELADRKIAEVAVKQLRKDIAAGYNHILMARCNSKERAKAVFELYREHTDLNPVMIFSGSPKSQIVYKSIINKEAKIIVCVDMLGEGFDLPELKIAAFHDIRKSLPITLQFAGRFTRTKHDEQLGEAYFVANIADIEVKDELEELYAHDADWNAILSNVSYGKTQNEIDFKNFISGFSKLHTDRIPFQNIRPKFSAVVYKNKTTEWFPTNFEKGIPGFENLEYSFYDINRDDKILIIITAKKQRLEWINDEHISFLDWNMIVVFWETKENLLFIHSSDNGSLYKELAEAIIGENAELIKGINVFKSFYNLKRTKLQNVGLRYFLGKDIRFRMSVGSDIAEALTIADKQRGEKAFVMGAGYEDGTPVKLGASYKGRIWNKDGGDLMAFKKWCIHLGKKLSNPDIDPNQILKETLIPQQLVARPERYPVWIDWDIDMYADAETKFKILIDGIAFDMSNTDLCLINKSISGDLEFSLQTDLYRASFKLSLFENAAEADNKYPDFKISKTTREKVEIQYGKNLVDATKFFEEYVPTIWFADGSALRGNDFVELKQIIQPYPKDQIQSWDWSGVNLSNESQGVDPKLTDSIQFKVIEELKKEDFDIIYDDDYSGEIADVISIKQLAEKIKVNLYHLKFALDGKVSNQVKNLYEVCGQAQKCVQWKHKSGDEFITHLLRRKNKTKGSQSCSRLEKGSEIELEALLNKAKKEMPMEFEIFIVQPGFSKSNPSQEILTLLGVTDNYIKEFSGIKLNVIASS